MSPAAFDATGGQRPGLGAVLGDAWNVRHRPEAEVAQTHIAWEGWGPVYGARTRLITVHHVLDDPVPWAHATPRPGWRARMVYRAARRGHRRTVALGIRTVVPSRAVADAFVRSYGADPSRIDVVPHFIDPTAFPPVDRAEARHRLGLEGEGPWLLHVGSDDLRKNVAGLLRILAAFRRRHPNAGLAQIGPSPLVRSAARDAPPRSLVHREGIRGIDRALWYAAADAVVLPSRLEGFGRVALEGLMAGRPVVTSELPVFQEELGPFYRSAPVDRPEAWALAIESALEEGERPERRAHVVRNFGEAGFRRAYRRIYAELGWLAAEGPEAAVSQPIPT